MNTTPNGGNRSTVPGHADDHEFTKVHKHGRKSKRPITVPTCTRLRIDPEACADWAEEIFAKGGCSMDDIDDLIALCDGNVDFDELRTNLRRAIEYAGIEMIDPIPSIGAEIREIRSNVTPEELTESIVAVLTRDTELPGTRQRAPTVPKTAELTNRVAEARRNLLIGISAHPDAVDHILRGMDEVLNRKRKPGGVFQAFRRSNSPDHPDTARVAAAAETLRAWLREGRDGSRRCGRTPVAALNGINLSIQFLAEVAESLNPEDAASVMELVSAFRSALNDCTLGHLPLVRRFASRITMGDEDPDDVFQVVFLGLRTAAERFDPDRGVGFLQFLGPGMVQSLIRWREEEKPTIRIPANKLAKLRGLDQAAENSPTLPEGSDTADDAEIARELGLPVELIRVLRGIPRIAQYPDRADYWHRVPHPHESGGDDDSAEIKNAIRRTLDELSKREADVLGMRYGIDRESEMTLEEVGEHMGLSCERVRQIEARALERLSIPGRKRRLKKLLGR